MKCDKHPKYRAWKDARECGACGRPIPEGGSLHCGLDHAPIVRCDECGNEIDPATCHCGACIIGHPADHSFVPIGCECTRSTTAKGVNADGA